MSCRFYESSPGYYGSCSAKRERARIEASRGSQRESDGYIEHREYREYSCDSGSSRCQNCPYYSNDNIKSGCFITTACVHAKTLPDNCYELETLRKFRDTYVRLQPTGEEDISLYYKNAPIIVNEINKLPNAHQIFCYLYQKLVLPCVELIDKEEYTKAYNLYRDITMQLKSKYVDK